MDQGREEGELKGGGERWGGNSFEYLKLIFFSS